MNLIKLRREYHFDRYEGAFIVGNYIQDSPQFKEVFVYYCPKEDITYAISVDQDGGEEMLWEEKGFEPKGV